MDYINSTNTTYTRGGEDYQMPDRFPYWSGKPDHRYHDMLAIIHSSRHRFHIPEQYEILRKLFRRYFYANPGNKAACNILEIRKFKYFYKNLLGKPADLGLLYFIPQSATLARDHVTTPYGILQPVSQTVSNCYNLTSFVLLCHVGD